jgi:HrpA-like RNA helicase
VKEETTIRVKNLFSDVCRTLSTALDPPDVESIGNSILNLQRLGALNHQLLITKLGLFMCEMPIDIFLTRFILISCLIGCPLEGLTISALLSQRRNFFQHQFSRSQELFLDTLYGFDNGDEDDLLIQLRIYREWEILFYEPFVN